MKKLYTTIELADMCKSLINKNSYYAVSKFLGVTQQCVASWYKAGTVMDDTTGLVVSDLLKLPPQAVLISLQMERIEKRHNEKLSTAWRKIAAQVAA